MTSTLTKMARKLLPVAMLLTALPAVSQAAPGQQGGKPTVSAPSTLVSVADAKLGDLAFPSVGGKYVAYARCGLGLDPCNIWVMDTTTKQESAISPSPYSQNLANTDGTTVVWMDARETKNPDVAAKFADYTVDFDIYAAKLSDRKEFLVAKAPKLQNRPKVAGDVIVWADFQSAKSNDDPEAGDIYMYQISTGKTTVVSNARSSQGHPSTDGKTIVWSDYRNEPDPQGFNGDVYGYDIATGKEFVVANTPDTEQDAVVSGNLVAYYRFGDVTGSDKAGIYGYDLTTKQTFPILVGTTMVTPDILGLTFDLRISGNLLVWTDNRHSADPKANKDSDIYGYDLGSKQEFVIDNNAGKQYVPEVSGDKVVYQDSPSGDPFKTKDGTIKLVTVNGITPSVTLPPAPPAALPGTGSRTFSETGKTVTGIFLDYWTQNGGLAQQGFPISEVMSEVSDLDGKPYTVQYFERAVFEYHPEISDPKYHVLLSQLGSFLYKKKYPNGAPGQQAQPGGRLFTETGKTVSGRFLEYWTQSGGLSQQGLPLSDPFMEKSDTDGKTYMVQYFERAVFEMHPENQKPNDVLLSLLGVFQHKAKYEGGSAPAPAPVPPAPAPPAPAQPTATPNPCAGVPASPDMTITPSACAKAGTRFGFVGSGFNPGETVGVYVTRPDQTVSGAPFQVEADAQGVTSGNNAVSLTTSSGSQTGVWAVTMEGTTSHKKAIGYIKLLAP